MRRAPAFAATGGGDSGGGPGLERGAVHRVQRVHPAADRGARSAEPVSGVLDHHEQAEAKFRSRRVRNHPHPIPAFSGVLAHMGFSARIESRFGMGTVVSENYFSLLGTNALFGRLIGPGDVSSPGGDRMVVLGHGAWKLLFGGDPAVVGRKALINGRGFDIIGICRPEFTGVSDNYGDTRRRESVTYGRRRPPAPFRRKSSPHRPMRGRPRPSRYPRVVPHAPTAFC